MRINKYIAHCGYCSRRQAESLILQGNVRIGSKIIIDLARTINEDDVVFIRDRQIFLPKSPRLWAYYKPLDYLVTHYDPDNRKTIFDNLPNDLQHVISVGRLDINSEGLLLLTNDGDLARYLELPKNNFKRKYKVRVFGEIDHRMVRELENGVCIDGVEYKTIEVEIERVTGMNSWIIVSLFEGKNREVRRVMEYFGLRVNRLIRLAYGHFGLGSMEPGGVREIHRREIEKLREGA